MHEKNGSTSHIRFHWAQKEVSSGLISSLDLTRVAFQSQPSDGTRDGKLGDGRSRFQRRQLVRSCISNSKSQRLCRLAPDQLAQPASSRPVTQSGEDGERRACRHIPAPCWSAAGRAPSDRIICQPQKNTQDAFCELRRRDGVGRIQASAITSS